MQPIKVKVDQFLNKHGMSPAMTEMETACRTFMKEMDQGLSRKGSSLAMLPTYLEVSPEVPRDQKVIVLDAGGTNFRVATIYFDSLGKAVIEQYQKFPMPGIGKETDKENFFRIMAEYMAGVYRQSTKIGFCFSYPVDMQPDKDGRVIKFSKEIKAREVVGELIGDNLKRALRGMGTTEDYRVVLLNDTVAALLAGQAIASETVYSSFLGFILGTGNNLCYIESNAKIRKKPDLVPDRFQLVDIESGDYGKAIRGDLDLAFDRTTVNPGTFPYEKMIAGRYLGGLGQLVLKEAANEGLFRDNTASKLIHLAELSSIDLNAFLTAPFSKANVLGGIFAEGRAIERTAAYYLLESLVERAAKLAAVSIAAAVIQSGQGLTPESPVCIVAEGTTFHSLKTLRTKLEYFLQDYLVRQKERYYEIVTMENAPLIGAAVAGLTN